jgi:hypothetical protein
LVPTPPLEVSVTNRGILFRGGNARAVFDLFKKRQPERISLSALAQREAASILGSLPEGYEATITEEVEPGRVRWELIALDLAARLACVTQIAPSEEIRDRFSHALCQALLEALNLGPTEREAAQTFLMHRIPTYVGAEDVLSPAMTLADRPAFKLAAEIVRRFQENLGGNVRLAPPTLLLVGALYTRIRVETSKCYRDVFGTSGVEFVP